MYFCLEMIRSLKQELEEWKQNQNKDEVDLENEEKTCKDETIEKNEEKRGILKIKKWLSFDKN